MRIIIIMLIIIMLIIIMLIITMLIIMLIIIRGSGPGHGAGPRSLDG